MACLKLPRPLCCIFALQRHRDREWLLANDIDRDVYFVAKIHRAHELRARPDIEEIARRGAFVLLLRRKR